MYIYDQGLTSGVSLGIGRLDAFGKSRKNKEGPDLEKAENLERIITRLSSESDWDNLEHYYHEWFKVRVKGKWQIYKMAAEAAMKRGDAASRYQRIITALILTVRDPELTAIGKEARRDEVLNDLLKQKIDLEDKWVDVDISLLRKSKGDLQRANGPFTTEQKDRSAALERAKKTLKKEKNFQGLLPIGDYTIDGEAVSLGTKFTIPRWKKAILRQKRNQPLDPQLESREEILPLEGPAATGNPL